MAVLNTQTLVVIAGLLTVLWLIGHAVRRRYFHPLSKYPGPLFNAVSSLPVVARLLTGTHHILIRRLHDEYGPVVRVSPNELSFCGANAWEDIYGFRTYDQPMEKDPIWIGALNTTLESQPLTYAPRDQHARQRRAFSHPFSNTSCIQQLPIIQTQIDKFILKLGGFAKAKKVINITRWFNYLTLDIIGDLCFAAPFGCLDYDDETNNKWCQNLDYAKRYGVYMMVTRRLAGTKTWLQKQLGTWLVPRKYGQGMLEHFLRSKDKVTARLQDTEMDHKDFIYYILRNNESKQLLTTTEILLNSSLFIGAGSDTTSAALSASAYILATHPKVYSTLVHEIRTACPTPSSITWSNIKNLNYLAAFLSETLRFFSPITIGMLRTVPVPYPPSHKRQSQSNGQVSSNGNGYSKSTPEQLFETYIDGYGPIPPGTTVSAHHYTSTRSALNWTRPHEFLPERWLHPEQFPHDKRHASQPFMLGPRGCIGKNLSLIEQKLILCSLLLHFDLELEGGCEGVGAPKWGRDPGTGDWRDIRTWMAWEQPDLKVRLTKRDVELS